MARWKKYNPHVASGVESAAIQLLGDRQVKQVAVQRRYNQTNLDRKTPLISYVRGGQREAFNYPELAMIAQACRFCARKSADAVESLEFLAVVKVILQYGEVRKNHLGIVIQACRYAAAKTASDVEKKIFFGIVRKIMASGDPEQVRFTREKAIQFVEALAEFAVTEE